MNFPHASVDLTNVKRLHKKPMLVKEYLENKLNLSSQVPQYVLKTHNLNEFITYVEANALCNSSRVSKFSQSILSLFFGVCKSF